MKNPDVPFGYEKDGKLYLSGWLEYPDREIGEVRDEDVVKSAQFFVERFSDLQKKIEEVIEKIETTENKGSFLMKLLHLKEQLPKHDGLGDYQFLYDQLSKYESLVNDIVKKNRERNTEIKSSLIEEVKAAVEVINWKEATEIVNDLKAKWIKTGNAEEGKNEQLEEEFWEIVKSFFDRKKNFYEDKQKLLELRQKKYQELVVEAEKTKELYGKRKFDRIKELRETWKGVGGVPNDVFAPLHERFNMHLREQNSSGVNYSDAVRFLEAIRKGETDFKKDEVDRIKQKVYRDKGRNPTKGKILELIQLLVEREFVVKLSLKRFPDFVSLESSKKKSIRAGIVKDLLARDKEELKLFEENSSNFTSRDGSMNKMLDGKLRGQIRKIAIKEKLLEWIENDEF
ncbi:MAG: DUF349 domain-containing protein [Cyclobacteriaceae bacterium]